MSQSAHSNSLRIIAGTDVGSVRTNNEDNFLLCARLGETNWRSDSQEELTQAGPLGTLLGVADGMGGASAGEVASQLAVAEIKLHFDELTGHASILTPDFIQQTLTKGIHRANQAIIAHGSRNPETDGMGTTLILGWLYEENLYLGWIGDSRAYLFRPGVGLTPISRDHSFVQELVNEGKITYEQAFFHPDGNIITQSLGNPDFTITPEVHRVPIGRGDLILICSDGLNGMLEDPQIESILQQADPAAGLSPILTQLINAANAAGGNDNITVSLLYLENAPTDLTSIPPPRPGHADPPAKPSADELDPSRTVPTDLNVAAIPPQRDRMKGRVIWGVAGLVLITLAAALCFYLFAPSEKKFSADQNSSNAAITNKKDSLQQDSVKRLKRTENFTNSRERNSGIITRSGVSDRLEADIPSGVLETENTTGDSSTTSNAPKPADSGPTVTAIKGEDSAIQNNDRQAFITCVLVELGSGRFKPTKSAITKALNAIGINNYEITEEEGGLLISHPTQSVELTTIQELIIMGNDYLNSAKEVPCSKSTE